MFGFKIGWTSAEHHSEGTIAAMRLQGYIFDLSVWLSITKAA